MVWESRHGLSSPLARGSPQLQVRCVSWDTVFSRLHRTRGRGHPWRSGSGQLRGRPGVKGWGLSRELWILGACAPTYTVSSLLSPSKPYTSPHLPPTTHSSPTSHQLPRVPSAQLPHLESTAEGHGDLAPSTGIIMWVQGSPALPRLFQTDPALWACNHTVTGNPAWFNALLSWS